MPASISLLPPRRSSMIAAPAELGDILDAKQVRATFFRDRVSVEWVLEHVAPAQKWYMGKSAVWYHGHVAAWMPSYVAEQQARAQRRKKAAR